jgi:hypothetical protein
VHHVGEEVQAAARVEQAQVLRARERMAWVRAHRRRGGLRVRDTGVDGRPRRSRHSLGRRGLGSRSGERGLGCHRCRAQRGVRRSRSGFGAHHNELIDQADVMNVTTRGHYNIYRHLRARDHRIARRA